MFGSCVLEHRAGMSRAPRGRLIRRTIFALVQGVFFLGLVLSASPVRAEESAGQHALGPREASHIRLLLVALESESDAVRQSALWGLLSIAHVARPEVVRLLSNGEFRFGEGVKSLFAKGGRAWCAELLTVDESSCEGCRRWALDTLAEWAQPFPVEDLKVAAQVHEVLGKADVWSSADDKTVAQLVGFGRGAIPSLLRYLRPQEAGGLGQAASTLYALDALERLVIQSDDMDLLLRVGEAGVDNAWRLILRVCPEIGVAALRQRLELRWITLELGRAVDEAGVPSLVDDVAELIVRTGGSYAPGLESLLDYVAANGGSTALAKLEPLIDWDLDLASMDGRYTGVSGFHQLTRDHALARTLARLGSKRAYRLIIRFAAGGKSLGRFRERALALGWELSGPELREALRSRQSDLRGFEDWLDGVWDRLAWDASQRRFLVRKS